MAGTSWDKLGQMDAAFDLVAPALRRVAQAEGLKLHEFFRDDPVWRLNFVREAGGEAVIDVAWQEDRPEEYPVTASWWVDDYDTTMRRSHQEAVGTFTRDRSLDDLEALVREALGRIDGWTEADLDQQSGPYPDWQRYQSRDEFYRTRLPRR
ncbi:MAG TPA: hypothetical protein VOB72_05825 [Candidatus Dormibacteraeota bacterium]|nr:hypothetical protein [Candidatus Dormibacteraeota bacterium]